LALPAEGKKFTRERSDARVCSYPMAAQIGDRRAIVAIKQRCLGLYPDKRGAKDFSDEAATQFVRAHARACDLRRITFRLRRGLDRAIWLKVSRRG
jgi:hypothetical protein